jgi:hypothetical protein
MSLTINHQTNDISATSGSVTIDGAAVSGGGSGISSLVADTTPQLGGNLDGNGKNILLGFDPTPDFDVDGSGSVNSSDYLDYAKIAMGVDSDEFDHLLGIEAPWTDTTIKHEYKIIKGSSIGAARNAVGLSGTDYGDLVVFGNVHSDGTNWNITTGMTIDGGNLRLIAQGEADHSTTGEASFTIDAADVVVTGTVDGRDIAANIPSSLGSAGQVLTVNSGGSAAEWAVGGPSTTLGAVGTYGLLRETTNTASLAPGSTRTGAQLRYANTYQYGASYYGSGNVSASGTWRLMGHTGVYNTSSSAGGTSTATSVFVRIS